MKKTLSALVAVTLLTAASFSALAAKQVDNDQAKNLQSIGTVSVSDVRGTLDDVTHQLAKKANAMGATSYRVIDANSPGDSSLWNGDAQIYR